MDVHVILSVWRSVCVAAALLVTSAELAGAGGGGGGWLGRLVLHHKNHFTEDLNQLAPIKIQASIEQAPAGYVDSPGWDYASVMRLLALIGASETARPVRKALRRALTSTNETAIASRRFMSRQKSYKFYPSLSQLYTSNMYYDVDTEADYSEERPPHPAALPPRAVVRLAKPVEARLPSAQISVNLLKDILEARALAARKMPTTKTTPGWTWATKEAAVLSTAHVTAKDTRTEAPKVTAPVDHPQPTTTTTAPEELPLSTTPTANTASGEPPLSTTPTTAPEEPPQTTTTPDITTTTTS